MIWDLAYNARVEAMRALLTSDNVDLTKKNEVGHDALYVALGNVFFNISEQCKYAIRTYGAETISTLLVNDFDDKIKDFDRNNNIRTYFAKLAYSRIYAEETYIKFREYVPGDSFNSERTYSEKVITYIKNNILGERNE